jgi:hypothetical protein
VTFYDRQEEIVLSVRDNHATFVHAGHQLGKDFVSAFIALWYFLCHHPCRVVTTSVKDDHLRVLWGEMGRFLDNSRYPLRHTQGGPLLVNHRDIGRVLPGGGGGGLKCPISYLRGMVSATGEGMAGHHAPFTLLIIDEGSGVADIVYERGESWAKRILVIGNPYPAGNNFFERGVKAGDLLARDGVASHVGVPAGVRDDDGPHGRLANKEVLTG